MKFICEKIKVNYNPQGFDIKSFVWRNREYIIREIISTWQDWKFPDTLSGKRTWLQRYHRNYFVVKTDTDEVFELYLDRKGNRRDWVLLKKLS
ncbi:TPA: hypothetical protein GXX44_07195 [bacterium]|nr:hypothetical protein [bacterium]